ncbi:hypothetical protein JJB07_14790 [Tumebacillus sp. ITR2]|uniref:Uncharacterized protein n=1 Tax=Tumebacillus amylolyticus TaxID=2801339 RepID=A0ABS1JCG8_9BACL|nr:hypothetical protein [Tumebacillus amylolyticus]MBL0387905.1 hypothetical protein [Tumebacillus amylolyticus]
MRKRQLVWVFFGVFGSPILFNFLLISWSSKYSFADKGDWMGFFGNYIGGIIGGIVAYIIAQIQFRGDLEKKFTEQYPVLIALKFEFEKIDRDLMLIKNMKTSDKTFPFDFRKDTLPIDKIEVERWGKIDLISNTELQVELIKLKEYYSNLHETFNTDTVGIQAKVDEILLRMMRFDQDHQNPSLVSEVTNKSAEILKIESNREIVYQEIDEMYNRFLNVRSLLDEQISRVEVVYKNLIRRVDRTSR